MGFSVIRKETGINLVLNPQAGIDGNFSQFGGSTVTRFSGGQARFGHFAYLISSLANNRGMNLTTSLLVNLRLYVVTMYTNPISGFANIFQASLNGGASFFDFILMHEGTQWARWQAIATANAGTNLRIQSTNGGITTVTLDGIQVEDNTGNYPTTYIDGDQGKGYRWAGLRHASISTRKDDVRTGGRELTFKATESVTADILALISDDGTGGLGITGLVNNTLPYALQPGAAFQNTKLLSRIVELEMLIADSAIDTIDDVLSTRKQIVDIWKPDAASPGQPTPFLYQPSSGERKLTLDTYYESGLEIVGGLQSNKEELTLRLLAVDPFWREDDRQRDALDFQDTDSDADYAMGRIDGHWESFGTGFNDDVTQIREDKVTGRVYFAGNFTTANGVAANRVCYWDGTTFVAMGSGLNAGTLNAMKIAPNGDVWVGGTFTTAGGAATHGVAKWDVSASSWVVFTNGSAGDDVFAIEIDSTGRIYIGGNFLNWDGDGDADRLAQSTDGGTNWTSVVAGGANNSILYMLVDSADNLYIGGGFTSIGGVSANRLAKWDGSAMIALGSGVNNTVRILKFGNDGTLFIGGDFTDEGPYITAWDGTNFETLGAGVNNLVWAIDVTTSGNLIVGGAFTIAGGITIADALAGWNGSSWFHFDIDMPSSTTAWAVRSISNGDIYIGFGVAGTATIGGSTTVTYNGTATVSPVITIFGPTTADVTATFQWLENQTTGQIIFFDMPINTDEIITLDTRPGKVGITSSFRRTIADNPLDPGGLSLFNLLPGDNVIATFITGTITGVEMFMSSDVIHHGIEGIAA